MIYFQCFHSQWFLGSLQYKIYNFFIMILSNYPLWVLLYFQKLKYFHFYFLSFIWVFQFNFIVLIIFIAALIFKNQKHLFHLFDFFGFIFFQFSLFLSLLISYHTHWIFSKHWSYFIFPFHFIISDLSNPFIKQ